jgi:HSP20 family protein
MSQITRWNPVRDLISMREMMDQVFNDRFMRATEPGRAALLPIDVYADENAIVLMADVPGLKPEELAITFEGGTLIIRGEIKPLAEVKNYLLHERTTGRFERSLTINTPINADGIEATFEHGVLTLTLPKAEAAKPKQISVKTK